MKILIQVQVAKHDLWEPERVSREVSLSTPNDDDIGLPWEQIVTGLVQAAIAARLGLDAEQDTPDHAEAQ